MKNLHIMLVASAILLAGAFLILWRYPELYKGNSRDVRLWMTYEEVLKIYPQNRNKLERAGIADVDIMSEEAKKYLSLYRLDLEQEHGLVFSFNPNFELISINRISRARVKNPSGGVPVLRR